MKEEDKIQKKIGTENPFRVPEGYFENLTSEVMNRLPEKEKLIAVQTEPTMWQKVRPWLYMTAMFIGAALIIRVALENSMLDDYSLYVYLADSDAE